MDGRSPCGSVDRNIACDQRVDITHGRSPCGSVDRNASAVAIALCFRRSLPVRERGSKHACSHARCLRHRVAPRAGAWIETLMQAGLYRHCEVAPRAGAWIETRMLHRRSRQRSVAPRAGAWIETCSCASQPMMPPGRSPCGSVDRNCHRTEAIRAAYDQVAPRAGAWIET